MTIRTLVSDYQISNELMHDLKHRSLEQKFLYMDDSAHEFYGMHGGSAYSPDPNDSLNINDYVNFWQKHIYNDKQNIAFISLGCGDMSKEHAILQSDDKTVIIGVDSSMSMLDIAQKTMCKHDNSMFIHADFATSEFRQEIENITKDSDKRIFAFLGSTISNVSQTDIADTLYNLLREDDLLWLDIQTRPTLDKINDMKIFNMLNSLLDRQEMVDYWLGPLSRVGIPCDNGHMTIDSVDEVSVGAVRFVCSFKFDKLTKINYRGEILHFSAGDKITLQNFRIYHPETMINFFADHGFEIVEQHLAMKKGQFLFRKN